jgi:major type 1 subunit fimbrin (pilin)
LVFFLPAPSDQGVALRAPLTGISAQISGTPAITLSGAGSGCSISSQAAFNYDSYNFTLFMAYPTNYANNANVFSGCNLTFSYVMGFYTNASFSQSTASGSMSTALFNVINSNLQSSAGDIGWGRVATTTQSGSSSNTYSYQLAGPGFAVSLESCTPSVSLSGSNNATVTLPTVSSNQLNGAGTTAGATPFTLSLNSCINTGSNYSATAYWTYTAFNSNFPNVIVNSASSNAATGVGIQILETTSGNPVLASGALGATTWTVNSSSNSAPAQTFNAYYYSTGTTNLAGTVTGVANYTMSYN